MGFFQLFGDGWFLTAMDLYLRMRLEHDIASPTFVYLLTHRATASFSEVFLGDPEKFQGSTQFTNFMH